ncbi:MAG: HEAT repeat domain-containing protein, partial [Myxococcales bacterium]|nr:HEAT repeat domain-containing protein [Myxococcales bacterium]
MSFKTALFGSAGRRWGALVLSNGAFYGAGYAFHRYIDESAQSPGLTFVLVAVWMALGVAAALCTVVALGETLVQRGFTEKFLRDEMAELDARIEGGGDMVDVPDDDGELVVPTKDGGIRFWLLFVMFAVVGLVVSNGASGGFLQRYTHPGVAVVHMRSDDPAVRRTGLNMLAGRLDFDASPAVQAVVTAALKDPDEGVAARAAFVAGTLGIDGLSPVLADMVRTKPALSFAGMIAMAQIGHKPRPAPQARLAAAGLVDEPNALAEPLALTYMLGMLRVPAIERLRDLHAQGVAKDDADLRFATIWALGHIEDAQVLPVLAKALEDEALAVRCAAAMGLEKLVVFESSEPLRKAFEASKDPLARCPETLLPVQEDGPPIVLVPARNYELTLVRALATTDDPLLLRWLVEHQEGREYRTHKLMKLAWESLKKKDDSGQLRALRQRRLQLERLQAAQGGDGGPGGDRPVDGG